MAQSARESLDRLVGADHGVLSTLHPERGLDAVPVVYALSPDGFVGIPVDRVKPKSSTRLQRVRNLEHDPRATLLVDHWDADDWTRLWWVRAGLLWDADPPAEVEEALAALLADKYAQYADRPFERVLVFSVTGVSGWSASVS